MKTLTAAVLASLALAGCTAANAQGIPALNANGNLPSVQARVDAQAIYQAECTIGRSAFLVPNNRAAVAVEAGVLALQALQAVGGLATSPNQAATAQPTQYQPATPIGDLEHAAE